MFTSAVDIITCIGDIIFLIMLFVYYSERASWSDPVQQKGHLAGQVYSEIMNKTVCKVQGKLKEIHIL